MGNIENKGVRVLRVSGKESGRSDITIGFFFETEGCISNAVLLTVNIIQI